MQILKKTILYSFLDLICCSLGAAFLLLLIAVVAKDEKPGDNSNLLVVRIRYINGFKAEVGIEYQFETATKWQRVNLDEKIHFFSAISQPSSGAEAFILINQPEEGNWVFRPFLVDYPADKSSEKYICVKFEFFGKYKLLTSNDKHYMKIPGDCGNEVKVYCYNK